MKVETNCKFCQKLITMEVDEIGFKNPAINAQLWLKNVACARCAAFYEAKRSLTKSIAKACLVASRGKGDANLMSVIRSKLSLHTQELARLICDFKMIQYTWDVEFVNLLLEKPLMFSAIINNYCQQLNRIQQQHEQPETHRNADG